ncbi:MFS transporter [Proteiniclasticum sp. SCR006]|uniref:MFS transporter n=1 Tax=Proteiniclasticum aestuarii TaxID=2817862 RepID=A0A939KJS8_9CLOT|nr:MFS transporter [Proteiniclasticum aestuarii]MBO1265483.1 MFS transporter [Proteiniclasticum aestuarii]
METRNQVIYNRSSNLQIGLFVLNNTATNLYMFFMMFVSYYATGVAGLLVVAVTSIMTAMRIFDGFTDPLIGFIIDKTESKIGKFRPYMVLGNIILAVSVILLHTTTHLVPQNMRLLYFILIYSLYIIGYTFQTACTKAAQTVLTNDPKQRPLFTLFDGIFNTVVFVSGQFLVSGVLVPKHGGFTEGFFTEMMIGVISISALFTALSVLSIWKKDVKENWGVPSDVQIRLRDYWPIIKGNRPLQMLIVSASTDKLAATVRQNSVTVIMLYGILLGNYALSGTLGLIMTPLTILLTFVGIGYARRLGQKKAYVTSTWISVALSVLLILFFVTADLTTISLSNLNLATLIFIALMVLQGGAMSIGTNIVIPMIADCSDYQTYKTGQYIPGMMGTIFSFVDKLISAFSASIVGVMVAFIGFRDQLPTAETPVSRPLFWMTLFFFVGIPVLGWLASLVSMKYYDLDGKKMEEIQQAIHDMKTAVEPTA